jgi:hypothetical protein
LLYSNLTMKGSLVLPLFSFLFFMGCSSGKVFYDDMYFSYEDAEREYRTYQNRKNKFIVASNGDIFNLSDSERRIDASIDIAFNRQYHLDDYHENFYAARIRRFGNVWNTWNYYDPYYTSMYWYNSDFENICKSIYQTYSWWGRVLNDGFLASTIAYSNNTKNPFSKYTDTMLLIPTGSLYYNSFDLNSYADNLTYSSENTEKKSFSEMMISLGMNQDIVGRRLRDISFNVSNLQVLKLDSGIVLVADENKLKISADKKSDVKEIQISKNYIDNNNIVTTSKKKSGSADQKNYRQWDSEKNEKIKFEKDQGGNQRSGSFSEGSRSYGRSSSKNKSGSSKK